MTPVRSCAAFHRNHRQRGSALLIALLLVVVMATVSMSMVDRSVNAIDASMAKRRYDSSVSCADAARALLRSQFSVYGVAPTSLTLLQAVGDKTLRTGHYDSDTTQQAQLTSVTAAGGAAGGAGVSQAFTNNIGNPGGAGGGGGGGGLGGTVYRFTVVCSDVGQKTHQSEVEYMVKFGF